jgi:cation:H+ antiporter
VAVACLPIFFTGHEIRRWEGALLLCGYIVYVAYLALDASGHDALSGFTFVVLWFALPLALLGIVGSVLGTLRTRDAHPSP